MDRNSIYSAIPALLLWSLSARRAWIEILAAAQQAVLLVVALRKESVDRNAYGRRITRKITRRSPQGERG